MESELIRNLFLLLLAIIGYGIKRELTRIDLRLDILAERSHGVVNWIVATREVLQADHQHLTIPELRIRYHREKDS